MFLRLRCWLLFNHQMTLQVFKIVRYELGSFCWHFSWPIKDGSILASSYFCQSTYFADWLIMHIWNVFFLQVNELHRVYRRQKELMDELRMRNLSANNIQGKTSMSNSIMSGGLFVSSDQRRNCIGCFWCVPSISGWI